MGCRTKNRIGFYNNLCKMPPHNTTNVYHLYCTVMEKDTSSTDLEEVNTSDERSTDAAVKPYRIQEYTITYVKCRHR